ncbi:tol-pal system YbgF family protein [Adhaeribacter radiodurans]|uniref:Tetratricopeptide repeat protein n=1 Tax=Adhaeribacter radiodurans TaxID=2745197 RepID=A0A7L7LB89_9BACT|nr:hypothetical protein [Adhaeribacter radiodurans]QMU29984.1 hypothetical protein HUW48_18990 [Adhaeribacter radiodurans]
MMDDFDKDELVEQYLLGQLQGEALTDFKRRLATDESFKKEVAVEQAILRNLKTVGRQQRQQQFENFHLEIAEEPETEVKVVKMNTQRYFLMAAASIVLIITSILAINNLITRQSTPEAIYQAYYEPYLIPRFRGAPIEADQRTGAIEAYRAGDYLLSIQLFEQFLAKENDEKSLFYLGNAYLAANKPEAAIKTYLTYLQQYKQFETPSKWYLGLSYIKVENNAEAKKVLKEVAANKAPDNIYREKAKEILSKRKFKKLPDE